MLKNAKILFIVEKNHQKVCIEDSIFYQNLISKNEIKFHLSHTVVPYFSYKYPNNLKYKELPYINDLQYKINFEKIKIEADDLIEKTCERSDYKMPYKFEYVNSYKNLNKDFLLSFDTIIFAPDPDGSGCYGSYMEIEQVLGKNFENLFDDIYFIDIRNLSNEIISSEMEQVLTNKDLKKERLNLFYNYVNAGKVKKYFDYNFQINCNILIKEVYKSIFLNKYNDNKDFEEAYTKYGFTKFMLFTVLAYFNFLKKNKESLKVLKNEYFLINWMYKYKGSGKYNYKNQKYSLQYGIGSVRSSRQIIENLKKLKIFEYVNGICFSDETFDFINLLNKKMFDPDLPFRISNWCDKNFEESKKEIDIYLKEIFIKQKIKNKYLSKGEK